MKITIQGQDYTTALDAERPLSIERKLNEPSVCRLWLLLPPDGSLASPQQNQALQVTGDDGTVYFTGYVAATPMPEYAGSAMEGSRSRLVLDAISDEILLDQAGIVAGKGASNEASGSLMTALVTRTGVTSLATSGLSLNALIGEFSSQAGTSWSENAGAVASQARAAYRAASGVVTLTAIPGAVHAFDEADGSLDLASLTLTNSVQRALANDVTVCGEHEPTAYVTELFVGDGVTTQFDLSEEPFFPAASKRSLVHELFDEGAIDTRVWSVLGSSFSLGGGGLTMQGGSGLDGSSHVSWLDPIEMGGTLLLEATGVTLAAGSSGMLAGFSTGVQTQAACTAGFMVTAQQGTGAVSVQPMLLGTAQGTGYATNPAHQYALRVRVHCSEGQRTLATYRSYGDCGAISCGGQSNVAGASLQFEIQEFVDGVAGMPVTLYDGFVGDFPAACVLVAASSINLQGTMRGVNLTSLGSAWVTSTSAGGTQCTRRQGTPAQSAECHVESSGRIVFYTGFAPPVGEQIAISYRGVGRAVGRALNAASQQALMQAGLSPVRTWAGSVTSPAARSSQDCRNAAQALLEAANGVSALWGGTYKSTNATLDADVWPGDALVLHAPSLGLNTQMVVRAVKLSYTASYPDRVAYAMAFANDWAEDLAIKTSGTVPSDAWLPATANAMPAPNLNLLTIAAMSGNTVTVHMGTTAAAGGGFEIRRRDAAFNPGEDADLVMRGAQSTMTFARTTASDRFYIRMFDGATRPNYSEFSAALIFNLPLAS